MTLTRKPRKRRASGTGCTIPRCRRLRYTEVNGKGMCAKHAADSVFAEKVRGFLDGRCWQEGQSIECNGPIQCAHVISRRYLAVRWDPSNAVPLCAAHHVYYTHRPLEWQELWPRAYASLRRKALNSPPERPEDVIVRLTVPTETG